MSIMNNYIPTSDIIKILKHKNIYLNSKIRNNINSIDCCIEFVSIAYNIKNPISFIYRNHFSNIFLHPKQLYNLFDNKIVLYKENSLILVEYDNTIYKLHTFIKFISNFKLIEIINHTITQSYNKLYNANLLILVFIGNISIGNILIEKLKKYKEIEPNCAIVFCIKKTQEHIDISKYTNIFQNSAIFISNEFGNDITPTLCVYHLLKQQGLSFNYIIKLHTKKCSNFNKLTDFLLTKKLETLLVENDFNKSSTISHHTSYRKYIDDKLHIHLYKKYKCIIKKDYFSAGTIFLTKYESFDKVLDFFNENYKYIVFNNMYDDNSINRNNSYVHFLERLFGYV
jgi:hypothetical protein